MNVGASIVRSLEAIGVEHMFGGAGEANAAMLMELKKSTRLKPIIVRNEQAASFMACGYSMFSDKLGVCFSTAGPGEFNLFSGLAVALSDSLPVLAISGFVPAARSGKGALNEATGLSRTPDSRTMMNATTKKSFIIDQADKACDIVEEAVNLAFEGRPGPVHIHVPTDVTRIEVPNFREITLDVKPVFPDEAGLAAIADTLASALAGGYDIMAIVGYGAIRSHAESEVRRFVERFQIPFVATMDGKGVLPEDHPLSLGGLGTAGDPGAERYFDSAKIVLAMGNSFAQNACYAFRPDLFDGKTLIHINIDPHEIGKVYEPAHRLVSDVKPAITALEKALEARVGEVASKHIESDKHALKDIQYGGPKIHPAQLVREMSRLLPDNAVIMGDAGGHMLWLHCHLQLTRGQVYQNPGSFGPMASMVNGAMGIKCASPERPVVCGCGDGAYLMAGFEFLTAVQNR
ncbi:MAG: thiamine pyrophosphate-binding protein, partial [Pseudomonadota bacterium]